MKRIKLFIIVIILSSIRVLAQSDYESYTYKLNASTSTIEFWTSTPSLKILKEDIVPEETGESIKVYCAKNEFEPFVLIVKPQSTIDITIQAGTFSSGIEIELNQVKYTYLDQASDPLGYNGDFPDALKPIEFNETINLSANENTAFWFTIYVPETIAGATDYTANLTINGINIPVTLHVFDFSVPKDVHVKSQMNFSHNTILTKYGVTGYEDDYWNYVDLINQFFIDHRLTPKSILWPGGLTSNGAEPFVDYDCINTLTDNYGIWGFEDPAERYLDGIGYLDNQFSDLFNDGTGFPTFMCATFVNNDPSQDQRPAIFCSTNRDGTWSSASSDYNTKWFNYIGTIESYLESNNLLDKAYYYMANEPQDQDDYDAIAWYSQELKSAAPNLKLMISEEPKPEIYNHSTYTGTKIDIWLPVLQNYDPDESWNRELNYDEESWIYFLPSTAPPYFNPITMDHQGIESKLTGWFLWKYRLKGIAYYSLNDWSVNPWTTPMLNNQNGNNFLFYPPSESNENITYASNNHRMVPSIRMELLRDGLEDYEYLYVLAGEQPEVNTSNTADTQVDKMISDLTSYNRDAEFMYNLRRLIGLKNGGEISSIPDIEPEAKHWRAEGEPGNYHINFQDPEGNPATTSTETVEGVTYNYFDFEDHSYLQIGTNIYKDSLGYGWYAPDNVNWDMRYDDWIDHNDLERSYIYSDWGKKATFDFDIPCGNYDVTVCVGRNGTYNNHNISIEGVSFFEEESISNECKTKTMQVSVKDGKLSLVMGNDEDYTFLNYLIIEATETTNIKSDAEINPDFVTIYPNPFKNEFKISYTLTQNSNVTIEIYDNSGLKVYSKFKQEQIPGTHSEIINSKQLDGYSGLYHVKIIAGNKDVSTTIICSK